VAASYGSNQDATTWRFTLRRGLRFSNGEPVLPSSFARGWERASDPDSGSHDAFLFNLVEGGAAKLAGEADTLSGVHADDEAMTLEVELAEPHADFDAIVAYQPFMPMPEAAEGVTPADWDDGVMVGNGPFAMDRSPSGEGVSLVRNPEWNGTCYGEALGLPAQPALARLSLQPPPSGGGYEAFEAGDADVARVPTNTLGEAAATYGNTFDGPLVSSTYLVVNWEDEVVGGPGNSLLRRAILQAIDREEIDERLFGGTVTPATGIAPPVVPGFAEGVCEPCTYDADAARAAYEEWQGEGNELAEPIRILSHAGPGGSDPIIAAIVADLEEAGIPAVEEPLAPEDFMPTIRDGGCQLCIVTASASFLGYDTFLYDLFHSEAVAYNNFGGFSDEAVDEDIDEARATAAHEQQADRYRAVERRLLGELGAAIPLYWSAQPLVHSDDVDPFPVNPLGLVAWERVSRRG
jgi:oligopeptide transport system substrate-binding protein